MQVILIDDVFNLGKRGDIVKVADGYGRNYLLPKNLAIPANPGNVKMVEQQRLALAKKEAKFKEDAQVVAQEMEKLHLLISRKSGESGALFGSVTAKDIADLLEAGGIHLDRRKIILDHPIKSIGNFTVEVRPHSEVEVKLLVSVLAEGGEAVAQVKTRDEESERIVAELEARVREVGGAPAAASRAASPVEEKSRPEDNPARRKSTSEETE